jgi:hypothetical protein
MKLRQQTEKAGKGGGRENEKQKKTPECMTG